MTAATLELSREGILAQRRRAGGLEQRRPKSAHAIRLAAWAGLQDSMPRAALLSLHARAAGVEPSGWEDPALVQIWGPRYSAYAVPRQDVAVFTLGRLPSAGSGLRRVMETADRLDAFLGGRRMSATEIGRGMGIHPNAIRYAAPTGRVLIRWDGARQPTVWTVPAPDMRAEEARRELARRHLHVAGPTTPAAFAQWAGLKPPMGLAAFEALRDELVPVRTPIAEGWILEADEPAFRGPPAAADAEVVRLLPSGDAYTLLHGADRELLVPDAARRSLLWTPRVWPGAVLIAGEIAGTWRRSGPVVTVQAWRRLSRTECDAVESEVAALPLPGIDGPILVRWETDR